MRLPLLNRPLKNFAWLCLNISINALYPIVLYPYLIRILGFHFFGEFSIMLAIFAIVNVVVDFGYAITGVRDITAAKDDKTTNNIFSRVIQTKLLIVLLCALVLIPVCYYSFSSSSWCAVFFALLLSMVGTALNPVWFLLAKNNVKITTIPNWVIRFIGLASCIVFIKSASQQNLVFYISGVSVLLPGLWTFLYVVYSYNIKLFVVRLTDIWKEMKIASPYFLSTMYGAFYPQGVILLLGLMAGKSAVGIYSAAEKIVNMLRVIVFVFAQSVYPGFCVAAEKGVLSLKGIIKKTIPPFLLLILVGSLLLFALSSKIIFFVTGAQQPTASIILKLIAFVPFILSVNIPFYQSLFVFGKVRSSNNIYLLGGAFSILASLILINLLDVIGAGLALLVTEIFISLLLLFQYKKIYQLNNQLSVTINS